MKEVSNLQDTHYSSSLSQAKKQAISEFGFTFQKNLESNMEENQKDTSSSQSMVRKKTLKEQEKRCIEIVSNKKIKEKMCNKVEEYLSKKILEERRRIKVMLEVLHDIRKNYSYFLFYVNIDTKKGIV